MRVSKVEFNIFWDEALGDDWYIDNDDLDNILRAFHRRKNSRGELRATLKKLGAKF